MKNLTRFCLLPKKITNLKSLVGFLALGFLSCGGPTQNEIILSDSFQQASDAGDMVLNMHKVEIVQVLKTETYMYMEVSEGGKKFWIATGPGSVRSGSTYYFNEAVRKFNFESKALDRVFDSIYLIPRLVPESKLEALNQRLFDPHQMGQRNQASDTLAVPDPDIFTALTIGELLQSPETYEGQWVEISGTCVKVNNGILGRNWVHLRAKEENGGEVVVTTQQEVEVGEVVRMQALVRRNRDFGSGYQYDLLLEDGFPID